MIKIYLNVAGYNVTCTRANLQQRAAQNHMQIVASTL